MMVFISTVNPTARTFEVTIGSGGFESTGVVTGNGMDDVWPTLSLFSSPIRWVCENAQIFFVPEPPTMKEGSSFRTFFQEPTNYSPGSTPRPMLGSIRHSFRFMNLSGNLFP